jgi:hypothetical protein
MVDVNGSPRERQLHGVRLDQTWTASLRSYSVARSTPRNEQIC